MEVETKKGIFNRKTSSMKSDFYTSDFHDFFQSNGSKTPRINQKPFLIYPESPFKGKWDLFITM